jgi:Protein of unknown function (DUF3142)
VNSRIVFPALCCLLFLSCRPEPSRLKAFPKLVLWAWEEKQDLRFLKGDVGVAFFAKHLRLRGTSVDMRPRRTPLLVNEATPLMAVVRIDGDERERPSLDALQLEKAMGELENVLQLPRVRALQIDFDARLSERFFYRDLLKALRQRHPALPISMTALVSWCGSDSWIQRLPMDEAVPMLFRMGPDAVETRERLRRGQDYGPRLARCALGLSLDEPRDMVPRSWLKERRVYVFHPSSWTEQDVLRIQEEIQR